MQWDAQGHTRKAIRSASPGKPVFALPVMRRAGVTNAEFKSAARYLDEQGLIAEGHDDYETFVVTSEGVERVAGGRDEVPDTERPEPS